jgi:copper chaperone NosL
MQSLMKSGPFSIPLLKTALALILSFPLAFAWAGERKAVEPLQKDKCPVCGMFVARYPDWLAEIVFKDGSYAVFDGAKDLFKYYLDLKKYNPGKQGADIDSIFLKDYYSVNFVDGFEAHYVSGSDTYGPMGRELIPFEKEAEAQEFMKDHKGQAILRFKDVTGDIIKSLD